MAYLNSYDYFYQAALHSFGEDTKDEALFKKLKEAFRVFHTAYFSSWDMVRKRKADELTTYIQLIDKP